MSTPDLSGKGAECTRECECEWSALPGWDQDNHLEALACLALMAEGLAAARSGAGHHACPELAIQAARILPSADVAAARRFFEANFVPYRVDRPDQPGFVTGYFEPCLPASTVATGRYRYPLMARPEDLVDLEPGDQCKGLPGELTHARQGPSGLCPYFDRSEIEGGALAGQGLELAYLDNPIDAYLVHVQGSATLELTNGERWRLSYDGKNGHPYTSIGKCLVEEGEIEASEMSLDKLRAWLERDPNAGMELMRRNRSYIFFRRTNHEETKGPMGGAGVPLTPGRSIAVDLRHVGYGTPVHIVCRDSFPGTDDGMFRRLMIAQDRGSAIRGPSRGDLFIGSGPLAGQTAGKIRHECEFYQLVPRTDGNAGAGS